MLKSTIQVFRWRRLQKRSLLFFRIFMSLVLFLTQLLSGLPLDLFFENPVVLKPASATLASYDFSDCGSTCDTDTGWWASDDDVDIFPFGGVTANRNTHGEADDTNYGYMASSDNVYASATNPGTGDEVFAWFEMTVAENPDSIRQIEFTFEGYPVTTTSNFGIYVKTAAGAYQDNASWTQVGTTTSITASTDTTITGVLTNNITDYIDGNGLVVWGVYNVTGNQVVDIDYVKMDVTYTPLEQEGFRFRNDDGSETTATWLAAQDTNITQPIETNTRLRMLVNANGEGDPESNEYQLEYKLSTDDTYRIVEDPNSAATATPVVQSRSSGASAAVNSTSHSITMPSGITAGDLLVIFFSTDGNSDAAINSGNWVKLEEGHDASNVTGAVFYKYAEGSDTATVTTSGSEQSSHIVLRISGAGVPIAGATNGNSTNSDPPSLDTGVSKNYLWVATRMGDSTVTATGAPSGYSNLQSQAAAGTGGASVDTAEYASTASTEDPGTFTSAAEQWVAMTVAIPPSGMGVEAVGAPVFGTTSISVPYPNQVSTGDLLVLTVANKTSAQSPATPTGWTAASNYQATGGQGTEVADSGTVTVSVFTKIAQGTETGNETIIITSGTVAAGRMFVVNKDPGKVWQTAMTSGSDETPDSTWSVTAGANPGITAGDLIFVVSGINSDFSIYDAQTVAATGITFQTNTDGEMFENGTAVGNDIELLVSRHRVLSGTASAAPTYSMTSRTSDGIDSPTGPSIFLRVRQVDAPMQLASSTNITASGETTTAQLSAPTGKTTGNFTSGRIQDDENPTDSVDLGTTDYTEFEWNLQATSQASDTEVYQFRVTVNGAPFPTYAVTPQWTIGTVSSDPDVRQMHYRWRNDDGDEGSPVASGWYDEDWDYRKKLTIDADQVAGSANHTDFPVLVSYTHDDLKDTSNSGHVGQSDGGDILFTNASGTKLDHEITRYVPSTGELIAWVEVSTLDYDDDTEIYVYYGNAAASDQWNIEGTWSNSYAMVHHFNETSGSVIDSTSNNNDSTSTSVTNQGTATSKIDGANEFDGSTNTISIDDANSLDLASFSFSTWINVDSFPGSGQYENIVDKGNAYFIELNDDDNFDCGFFDGSYNEYLDASTSLSTGTYYHLACAFDATTDSFRMYVNGVETVNETETSQPDVTTAEVSIGDLSGSNGQYLDAKIDEIHVSNVGRSADWITTEYNNQNNPGVGGFLTSISSEETSGGTGATWEAVEDTAITDVPKSTLYRVRFALSNEGGVSSGAVSYQLEVAETGTCSSGSYSAVPTDTSGDWQIAASTHLTDGGATTNFSGSLTDENTTFVAGEVKDTGNTTGNITLDTTNFTEIEFAVAATTNATDGGTYCFRLSNVDTYSVYPQATIVSSGETQFTQSAYRWYEDSDSENVTEIWGNPNIAENGVLALLPATNAPPDTNAELRLRIALSIGSADLATTSQQFKLQYKAGTDASCTSGSWTDVGAESGGSIWRYASSSVTDGTTLTALKISSADVLGVYAKSSPTTSNPNAATVGQDLEYDFHIQHNGAAPASTYSFRIVESDGTALTSYTNCPTLVTKHSSDQQLRHGAVFSDEVEAGFTSAD